MNGFYDEFKNWTLPMRTKFGAKLMNIITRRKMGMVCCGIDLNALRQVFPDRDPKNHNRAYAICIQVIMVEIGHLMREWFPGDKVLLIHDRGNWDADALAAFNTMVGSGDWPSKDVFLSIAPMSREQSVGLQAADLIAFEAQRALQTKLIRNSEDMRWAMLQFEDKKVPRVMKYMDLATITKIRHMVGTGIYDGKDNA
jgi:hypothetical protein